MHSCSLSDLPFKNFMNLPIENYKSELVDALREYETLIVVGDTGSGKTTQIPKYIFQSFDYKVFFLKLT